MFALMLMGGGAIMSIMPVYVRCRIFEENAKKSYDIPDGNYWDLCNHLSEICVEVGISLPF